MGCEAYVECLVASAATAAITTATAAITTATAATRSTITGSAAATTATAPGTPSPTAATTRPVATRTVWPNAGCIHRIAVGFFAVKVWFLVGIGEISAAFNGDGLFPASLWRGSVAMFLATTGSAVAAVTAGCHLGALLSQDRLA